MTITLAIHVASSDPNSRESLLAQWVAMRSARPKDKTYVWSERDATRAINAALRVAESIGDRECIGHIAFAVDGARTGVAHSDAVEIKTVNGEVMVRVLRMGGVRSKGKGLAMEVTIRGKGAKRAKEDAQRVFRGVVDGGV